MQIIQLDGNRTGPKRIAQRFAAERARVESFNHHMVMAMMPWRTALWNLTPQRYDYTRKVTFK